MNNKELIERVLNNLDDLLAMQRHITLKVNLIEEEIKTLKINSSANMGKIIERTNIFNKELGKRIRNDILTPRISNKGNYQQGSLDEKNYI